MPNKVVIVEEGGFLGRIGKEILKVFQNFLLFFFRLAELGGEFRSVPGAYQR